MAKRKPARAEVRPAGQRDKKRQQLLAPATALNLAIHLNLESAAGKLADLKRGRPRYVGPLPPLIANELLLLRGERAPAMAPVALEAVTPALLPSFNQTNFSLFGIATPNEALRQAKERLLDELERHGVNVAALRRENRRVHIHTEGDEAGGLTIHESEAAVSFAPGITFYCGFWGWVVIVYDSHYHIVLPRRTAVAVLADRFQNDADRRLTDEAISLLHELLHWHVMTGGCLAAGVDEVDFGHLRGRRERFLEDRQEFLALLGRSERARYSARP